MGLLNYTGMWNFCFDLGPADCALPVHDVTFETSFYMGKTEVTRAQWFAVMGSLPDEIVDEEPDTRPVNYVSWTDAQDFVSVLNNLGQGTFRLPSEAEWEYSCRAGTTTRFYFGDSDCDPDYVESPCSCELDQYGWWKCSSGQYYGPEPVSQKLPNAWGLYDMHGNVGEFCQDDWHDNFIGAPSDGSAWITGQDRIVYRGGSILSDPIWCQSAARTGPTKTIGKETTGFRVVREKD
jgi:formylglycine-generating enzyme required for sulfatase activity